MSKNFYPDQYTDTLSKPINHNYLREQFSNFEEILQGIATVVRNGDYTLGKAVDDFEEAFAELTGCRYAVGVGSGTDAIFLSLKALGIGNDRKDEVITTAYTFYATVGAIVTAGAKPIFVDIDEDYNIDPSKIENAITKNTKAIVPVHWSGKPCRMDEIIRLARKHDLAIVEDACHAITATFSDEPAGSFGDVGCFSLHPLKNLNVWGDGGVVTTNSSALASKLYLIRNHGLSSRDVCEEFAYNSRLDTIQAVVGKFMLDKLPLLTCQRIKNAQYLDAKIGEIEQIKLPRRDHELCRSVYHLYSFRAENRDELNAFLSSNGVDSKVHYPTPMHLQPAASQFGYSQGDLPMTELVARETISLPVHEFVNSAQLDKMASLVSSFYKR